ncbi:hypothetical protein CERSUDRAFT_74642 [Gelatoporia subvermispora B]|uniref:Uncharacterized protein n=1 Tax=Ceriporiopsis subvermispora (strain B) TaxID=914234 RepID=M2PI70_CERS8|nr:hypothetical protein CERSUDRAFT_74642 [Gelatoporia subvermispora B]
MVASSTKKTVLYMDWRAVEGGRAHQQNLVFAFTAFVSFLVDKRPQSGEIGKIPVPEDWDFVAFPDLIVQSRKSSAKVDMSTTWVPSNGVWRKQSQSRLNMLWNQCATTTSYYRRFAARCSLYKLMKQIRNNAIEYICEWKVGPERLRNMSQALILEVGACWVSESVESACGVTVTGLDRLASLKTVDKTGSEKEKESAHKTVCTGNKNTIPACIDQRLEHLAHHKVKQTVTLHRVVCLLKTL